MQKLLALLGAKSKEEFLALLAQFIKFGLVGVSNTAVSMAVYYIFLWIRPGPVHGRQHPGHDFEHCQRLFLER